MKSSCGVFWKLVVDLQVHLGIDPSWFQTLRKIDCKDDNVLDPC